MPRTDGELAETYRGVVLHFLHDIRHPLQSMRVRLTHAGDKTAESVLPSVEYAEWMVQRLHLASTFLDGRRSLQLQQSDLLQLIQRLIRITLSPVLTFYNQPRSTIQIRSSEISPLATIDPDFVGYAIGELVFNSLKYSKGGGAGNPAITLHVEITQETLLVVSRCDQTGTVCSTQSGTNARGALRASAAMRVWTR